MYTPSPDSPDSSLSLCGGGCPLFSCGAYAPPPHGAESVRSRYISPRPPRATGGDATPRVETHMRCEATPFSVLNGVRRCQATVLKEGRKEGRLHTVCS